MTAFDPHFNFGITRVAIGGAPSPATTGTSLGVTTGYGATVAAALAIAGTTGQINATVYPYGTTPNDGTPAEIIRVTAAVGDTLTILRHQESTAARAIVDGDTIEFSLTAKSLTDIEATLASKQGVGSVFGDLVSLGDSRSQTGDTGSGGGPGIERNYSHIVAAYIHANEAKIWGQSAARGSAIYDAYIDIAHPMGSGALVRHHLPPHMESQDQKPLSSSRAKPALTLLNFGLNDGGAIDFSPNATIATQILNAYTHGMRTMISKTREAVMFDSEASQWVYTQGGGASNGWAADATQPYWMKGVKHKTIVSGNVATFTLPPIIRAPASENIHLCILLYGNPNAYTQIAAASSGAVSPTTITVQKATGQFTTNATDNFPSAGVATLPIAGGGTQDAAYSSKTATTLVLSAGGQASMSGKTLAATGADVTISKASTVTLSGTVANSTGTVVIGGQGVGGLACHVVKRIPITNADAGGTVIITGTTVNSGDEFSVGGCWIEDPKPPLTVLVNTPAISYASLYTYFGCDGQSGDILGTLNAGLASLAAEFDNAVQVADVAAKFKSLYAGTWGTGGSGTGTTNIKFVPFDPTNCVGDAGSILRFWAGTSSGNSEEIRVKTIDKTNGGANDGTWLLTSVDRAYTGSIDSGTSTSAQNRAAGTAVYDVRTLRPSDRIHPSEEGHFIVAGVVINLLNNYVTDAYGMANAGGVVAHTQARGTDGGWIGPQSTSARNSGTLAAALDTIYAYRVLIPEEMILTSLNMQMTVVAGTGGKLQMGIWADGQGCPGGLIHDTGDIAIDAGGGAAPVTKTAAMWKKVLMQWVWMGWCVHVGAPTGTFRAIAATTIVNNGGPLIAPVQNPPTGAYAEPNCLSFSCTTTGAGQALPLSVGPTAVAGVTAATPWLWAQYTLPVRD